MWMDLCKWTLNMWIIWLHINDYQEYSPLWLNRWIWWSPRKSTSLYPKLLHVFTTWNKMERFGEQGRRISKDPRVIQLLMVLNVWPASEKNLTMWRTSPPGLITSLSPTFTFRQYVHFREDPSEPWQCSFSNFKVLTSNFPLHFLSTMWVTASTIAISVIRSNSLFTFLFTW